MIGQPRIVPEGWGASVAAEPIVLAILDSLSVIPARAWPDLFLILVPAVFLHSPHMPVKVWASFNNDCQHPQWKAPKFQENALRSITSYLEIGKQWLQGIKPWYGFVWPGLPNEVCFVSHQMRDCWGWYWQSSQYYKSPPESPWAVVWASSFGMECAFFPLQEH